MKNFIFKSSLLAVAAISFNTNASMVGTAPPANSLLGISAVIDGQSQLIVTSNSLQWHHLSFIIPGESAFYPVQNNPTIISLTVGGNSILNNFNWFPTWPGAVPNGDGHIRGDRYSSILNLQTNIDLADVSSFYLNPITSRGVTSIAQLPDSSNGQTLIIDFNDAPIGASDLYEAQLSYQVPAVPIPAAAWLMFSGLAAMGAAAKRRKSASV